METVAFVEKANKFSSRSRFSDDQILGVAQGGRSSIADWVSDAASRHGVTLRSNALDTFARAVSKLSDGVVDLDPVEETLVAMSRAGVINAYQRCLLQVRYLR